MRANKLLAVALTLGVTFIAMSEMLAAPHGDHKSDTQVIAIPEDNPALEFVGQFINAGTSSHQFGYIARIDGLDQVFNNATTQNESTAMFTFFTDATTVHVFVNGPLKIVERTGTTTIYFNPVGGASFADPSSFQAGTPIVVSDYRQQVLLDTTTNPFVTTHLNTITSNESFQLAGTEYRLGRRHQSFRTHYLGHSIDPAAPASGWFGGYAVGVDRDKD
jgi:hypothetical protein